MANKRMFCKDITESDAFLDMPTSSQLLYFHLGMNADDDGFLGNPKKIARSVGVGVDDMKILISKSFVIVFPSGVLVIKHHRMNNNWDSHNCKRTLYLEEFNQLCIKQNKAYTLDKSQGKPLQSETSLKPVFRIEENRIDKNRKEENKERVSFELFWEAYGKKKDKPKCEAKWSKLSFEEQTAVIEYIPKYLSTIKDKQYQKYPATFLNNRSWENDIDEKEIDTSGWSDMKIIEKFGVAGLRKYRGDDFKM